MLLPGQEECREQIGAYRLDPLHLGAPWRRSLEAVVCVDAKQVLVASVAAVDKEAYRSSDLKFLIN